MAAGRQHTTSCSAGAALLSMSLTRDGGDRAVAVRRYDGVAMVGAEIFRKREGREH